MRIKDRAKPKLPPVEPGVYIGICVGVIDLGEQYNENFKKYSNDVQLVWELVGETVEVDGEVKPRQLSRTFSVALNKKSKLRAFLSSWNAKQYTDEEYAQLELFDQLGRACQLNVILNDTGEYANVDNIMPLPKGMPAPGTDSPLVRWDMEAWDDEVFKTLPEWVQEKIKKSTQYQKEHTPADSVDFPAEGTPSQSAADTAASSPEGGAKGEETTVEEGVCPI